MFAEVLKLWGGDSCPKPAGAITMSPLTTTKSGLETQLKRPFAAGKVYYYDPTEKSMGVIKIEDSN